MKNIYILFILILLILCFTSTLVKAQTHYIEVYSGCGNTFTSKGYTFFNMDFSNIFTSTEEIIYSIYMPIDYYFGFMINKKYLYFNGEIEIANFFSVSENGGDYSGLLNYFKGGSGFYFSLGPFLLKIGLNAGLGFYLLKVFQVTNPENLGYIGQILADGFIFIEPTLAIGVKLGSNFTIYLGQYIQYGLFFSKQLNSFSPSNTYLLISVTI
jgi:hypothetical protein